MLNTNPNPRPFVAAIASKAPADPIQAARNADWAAVEMAEACDPNVLRALRDQQQGFQSAGVLT